jgi:hypothetical protein
VALSRRPRAKRALVAALHALWAVFTRLLFGAIARSPMLAARPRKVLDSAFLKVS